MNDDAETRVDIAFWACLVISQIHLAVDALLLAGIWTAIAGGILLTRFVIRRLYA